MFWGNSMEARNVAIPALGKTRGGLAYALQKLLLNGETVLRVGYENDKVYRTRRAPTRFVPHPRKIGLNRKSPIRRPPARFSILPSKRLMMMM